MKALEDPSDGCPSNISLVRCSFLERYKPGAGDVAIWDNSQYQIQGGQKQICETCFLLVVLFFMFTGLSGDVTTLVIQPIESMVPRPIPCLLSCICFACTRMTFCMMQNISVFYSPTNSITGNTN